MSTLTAKLHAGIWARFEGDADYADDELRLAAEALVSIANGTGDGQCDLIFADSRSLAASTSEDLDVSGGLSDAFGNTITMVKVKGILVVADPDNGDNIVIGAGGGALPIFSDTSDKIPIEPGGRFLIWQPDTGIAVTASTGDDIGVENADSGAAGIYKIVILGTSA